MEFAYYSGWRILEERERKAQVGQTLGAERVVRQFVDGGSIDEHIAQDVYGADGTSIEKTLWYHQNHRGDTVAITDAQGNVVVRYAYSAYGDVYEINAQGALVTPTELSLGVYYFHGREFDEETGLYAFRNRLYSPTQGRFLSRDPIMSDLYLYEAFYDSPYGFADPYGTQSVVADRILAKSQPNYTGVPQLSESQHASVQKWLADRAYNSAYITRMMFAAPFEIVGNAIAGLGTGLLIGNQRPNADSVSAQYSQNPFYLADYGSMLADVRNNTGEIGEATQIPAQLLLLLMSGRCPARNPLDAANSNAAYVEAGAKAIDPYFFNLVVRQLESKGHKVVKNNYGKIQFVSGKAGHDLFYFDPKHMTSGQMLEELIHQAQKNSQGFTLFTKRHEAQADILIIKSALAISAIERADRIANIVNRIGLFNPSSLGDDAVMTLEALLKQTKNK